MKSFLMTLTLLLVMACNRHKVDATAIHNTWDRERLSTTIDDERFVFFTDGTFFELRKGAKDIDWRDNAMQGADPLFKVSNDSLFLYQETAPGGSKYFVKKHKINRLTSSKLEIDGIKYNVVK